MSALWVALVLCSAPLEEGREAYQSGRLEEARRLLEEVLYPLRLDDAHQEREARLLLAATYFAQGERYRAEEEAVRAFAMGDERPLDPLLFPPDFVDFAQKVRRAQPARPAAAPPPPPLLPAKEASLPTRQPPGLALVPFGAPQFRQERKTAGALLAGSQGACLAAAAGGLAGALTLRGADGLYSAKDAAVARPLNAVYVAGAWCFVGLYGYGVLDALLHR